MRERAKASPPHVERQLQDDIVTQERTYTVITPLFGGGAIAGQQDEVTVVRGTEIRGHLRFWWRACFGGRYGSVEEMKKEEDRIWGAANQTKKNTGENEEKREITVQILVETINKGYPVEPFLYKPTPEQEEDTENPHKEYWYDEYNADSKVPQYAAFMFQLNKEAKETQEEPERKLAYKDVKFKLTISFAKELRTEQEIQQGKDTRRDIEGALWAWEIFGGIGARTRRGFGAIQLKNAAWIEHNRTPIPIENEVLPVTLQGLQDHFRKKFVFFGIEKKAPGDTPSLSREKLKEQIYLIVKPSSSNAEDAWKILIDRLRTFRQPGKGQNNHWLDTKEIKRLRNTKDASSQQPYKFPKAVLGLPIVFHFAEDGKDADLTLQGAAKGKDRLASSLILRPLVCQNTYIGLVLLLENHVENATFPVNALQVVTKEQKALSATIEASVSSSDTEETILKGKTDVWKAFWEHLRKNS